MTSPDLDPELASFVAGATAQIATPFGGSSRDYRLLAAALKGRILRLQREGRTHEPEISLLAQMEEMAEKVEGQERARALLDALTDPSRREERLIEQGLCLACQGMRVNYVFVAGSSGGRTTVSCAGCGGSGEYQDYQKRLDQADHTDRA